MAYIAEPMEWVLAYRVFLRSATVIQGVCFRALYERVIRTQKVMYSRSVIKDFNIHIGEPNSGSRLGVEFTKRNNCSVHRHFYFTETPLP